MQPPDTATTVRVQEGATLTTDGPFVSVKEALGGSEAERRFLEQRRSEV
jgi:hypothetical protein